MKLLVVESPSKAKTIQKYLGDEYIVLSSMGSICDLNKGGKFGIGIDINNNFKPYYSIMSDKIDILNDIINAASKCDMILLGMDEDREGESIAAHLYRYLISTDKPIKRIKFNEITKSAIHKSMQDLQDIDQNLVSSQEARRILDRIVGFMVSPYLMAHYGPNLSAGRVQSVAVRMIADREKDIESFIPKEFWNISAKFTTNNAESFIAKYQEHPVNQNDTDLLIENLKQQEYFVFSVKGQKKKEKPCAPLTTASLQRYMARKYSFEPDRTMKSAQSLYENGFCTYIRTDSTRISDEAIDSVRKWIADNNFDVPKKSNVYETKSSAQDAHECIRPTNVKNVPNNSILSGDEKTVYTAIWQHFIASQMNPAVWNTMNICIRTRANAKLSFIITGRALEYKGYLEIFGPVALGKIEIPTLKKDDILILDKNSFTKEQKFTQPPPRFNNASILEELEDRQIGRPATYADIIKKISHRNYVEKNGTTYKPTELGKKITNVLVELFPFMEYNYTAQLEKQLDKIAAGTIKSVNVLENFFVPFKSKLNQAYMNNGSIACDKCKSVMCIKTNSINHTKFFGCLNFPFCKNIKAVS